jgi:dihydrofolate reductase
VWWAAAAGDKGVGVVRTAMNRHNAGMGRLRYTAITSLDGYINDADGGFEWAFPTDELHQVFNSHDREVGTHLLGRGLYEVMTYWETAPGDVPGPGGEYARIWRAADKVVYSRTLEHVTTARTRLEADFDPAAVTALKAESVLDISVGGAGLAAEAFRAGLVDDVHLFAHPVLVGGGTRALPHGIRLDLELVTQQRIGGVVHTHHRVRR